MFGALHLNREVAFVSLGKKLNAHGAFWQGE